MEALVWLAAGFIVLVIAAVVFSGPPKEHWDDNDYR